MPTIFSPAPDVEDIGRTLIRKYHKHLLEQNVRVEYLFRSDTPNSKGKDTWGTARKVSGLNAFLANSARDKSPLPTDPVERDWALEKLNQAFFVITISEPIWKRIKEETRIALVDHELMHCWAEAGEKGVELSILGHDLECFKAEFDRHGLWRNDAKQVAESMLKTMQPALFEVPPKKPEKGSTRSVAIPAH